MGRFAVCLYRLAWVEFATLMATWQGSRKRWANRAMPSFLEIPFWVPILIWCFLRCMCGQITDGMRTGFQIISTALLFSTLDIAVLFCIMFAWCF